MQNRTWNFNDILECRKKEMVCVYKSMSNLKLPILHVFPFFNWVYFCFNVFVLFEPIFAGSIVDILKGD